MKAVLGTLLLAFCCAFLSARADVIVSGSASTSDLGAAPCSDSGAAPGSLTESCSSSGSGGSATASAIGSGGLFSGSISAMADVTGPPFTEPGLASGSIDLMLNQSYMMTGGTGMTTVVFNISGFTSTSAPGCSFTFNGVAAPVCNPLAQTYTETVAYDVPFSVQFDLNDLAKASNGAPSDGSFSYDFNQPGLQATPEPSSVWLLVSGLAAALFTAGRTRRSASDRA